MHQVVLAHTYLFWVRCYPSRTSLPKEVWAGTPKWTPSFSPLPDHNLWNRWPVAHLPCIGWVQVCGALAPSVCSTLSELCFFLVFTPFLLSPCLFDSAVRVGWFLSFVAWRMCGLLGSYSLPFTPSWTGRSLGKIPYLPAKLMSSFSMSMGFFVIDLAISLCCACCSFTSPFIACYPMDLRTDAPAVPAHFFFNLLLKTT